jgi:hypothetical protein
MQKPKYGSKEEILATEVMIFSMLVLVTLELVLVVFGEKEARVVEIAENLLTVMSPPVGVISQPLVVNVIVSNRSSNQDFPAATQLAFTYTP